MRTCARAAISWGSRSECPRAPVSAPRRGISVASDPPTCERCQLGALEYTALYLPCNAAVRDIEHEALVRAVLFDDNHTVLGQCRFASSQELNQIFVGQVEQHPLHPYHVVFSIESEVLQRRAQIAMCRATLLEFSACSGQELVVLFDQINFFEQLGQQ